MKKRTKFRGTLTTYLRWPLLLSPLLVFMNFHIYFLSIKAGFFMTIYLVVYLVLAFLLYYYKRSALLSDLVDYAVDFGQVQRQLLKEMVLPFAIIDAEGHLLWGNDEFLNIIDNQKAAKKHISNVIPMLTEDALPVDSNDSILHLQINSRYYQAILRSVTLDSFDFTTSTDSLNIFNNSNTLITLYLNDETEVVSQIKENKDQRLVIGLLYIDNYEESLESIDEVRCSLLTALIDRKINKYMQDIDAIIKKMEKDKYLFVFQDRYLSQLQADKFSVLEEVRNINIGNEIAITISMGLGIEGDTFSKRYGYARTAIDLALGRGGDQVVLKDGENILYYGGKSVQVEKNTRVKARVKAHALKELVEAAGQIVIMGHTLGDVDSFGSAIGIYRIAKSLGKTANIVINDITSSLRPMITKFKESQEYEETLFITSDKAKSMVNMSTLLVIVDVNKPSYTECPDLLALTKTIVILDHHRQTGEGIENPVLSYIESYASSSCEMVAEILQYIGDGVKLKPLEADAMYSGIMVDTNNFMNKTGVRTFEAVAYLRRNGADATRIRKLFRTNMDELKIQAEAIQSTELFLNNYAISVCSVAGMESPTVAAAKVANSLLDINGVKASFVLTEFNNKIYISARSIDELNVQVMMEKLGGGGHISAAGAQMDNSTIDETRQMIRKMLTTMKEEGDL